MKLIRSTNLLLFLIGSSILPTFIHAAKEEAEANESRNLIVGGSLADSSKFPYLVDIYGLCMGILIAPGVVLSTAFCNNFGVVGKTVTISPQYRPVNYLWIDQFDEIPQEDIASDPAPITATVVEQLFHPSASVTDGLYDGVEYDFTLLRLDTPVTVETNIELILNKSKKYPKFRDELDVVGLGETEDFFLQNPPDFSSPLKRLTVGVLQDGFCEDFFNFDLDVDAAADQRTSERHGPCEPHFDADSAFCAVHNDIDLPCISDMGAPLVRISDRRHVVMGLLSLAESCLDSVTYGLPLDPCENYPDIYARMSAGTGWIREQVCDVWGLDANFCTQITWDRIFAEEFSSLPINFSTQENNAEWFSVFGYVPGLSSSTGSSFMLRRNAFTETITPFIIRDLGYVRLQLRFYYITSQFEAGDSFFVDLNYNDQVFQSGPYAGDLNYAPERTRTFTMGQNFDENGEEWNKGVARWNISSGYNKIRIRFSTIFDDGDDSKILFIDRLRLSGGSR